jgi:hypothetical protein
MLHKLVFGSVFLTSAMMSIVSGCSRSISSSSSTPSTQESAAPDDNISKSEDSADADETATSAQGTELCLSGAGAGKVLRARVGKPVTSGILYANCGDKPVEVTPSLPAGLTINSQHMLAGIPTGPLEATTFEIKIGEVTEALTLTFDLAVSPALPATLTYGGSKTVTRGIPVAAISPVPQLSGGSFSISPNLPSGLGLDPLTGTISGTPLLAEDNTMFTVTFIDEWETSTSTLEIEVKIPPPSVSYGTVDRTIVVGTTMTPWQPDVEAEGTLAFTIDPALPPGLVLGNDGTVSGFPLAISAATTYTVTLTNEGGSQSANLTLTVSGETLDLTSFSLSSSVLPRRQGWGATHIINDRIYFYGGNAGYWGANSYAFIQSAPISDPLAWTDEGQIFPGDFGWSPSLRIGSKIYFYGSVAGIMNKIYSLDVSAPLAVTDTTKTLPQNFFSGCIQAIENEIYFFGGAASAGTNIWKAPTSAPAEVLDTGQTLPFSASHNPCFTIDQNIYIVAYSNGTATSSVAKTYRASRSDPTNWSLIETKELGVTQQNSGVTLIIGEYIYLFATHMSQKVYKAPLTSPGAWVDTGATYPAIAWGSGNFQRVGNKIYFFGGNGTDYKGINKIITVDVLP